MRTKEEVLQGEDEQAFTIRCSMDLAFFCRRVLGYTIKPFHQEWCDMLRKHHRIAIHAPTGFGKSSPRGTKVIMANGTIEEVQNIKEGDQLMGPDSKPRTVTNTHKGFGPIYRITPKKGESWECNDVHMLSLKCTGGTKSKYKKGDIVNIGLDEYLKESKWFKHIFKLWRTGVEFPEVPLEMDPYIVGLYLADGEKKVNPVISCGNEKLEAVEYLKSFCKIHNLKYTSKFKHGAFYQRIPWFNDMKKKLIKGEERYIPENFLINSRDKRLQLLAGILDGDGHLIKNTVFELTCKDKSFAKQVAFLGRSLGLAVTMKKVKKSIKSRNFTGTYYRLHFSGNTDIIPTKIKKKQAYPRKQKKDHLVTGFDVEYVRDDDYYGIALDGDHLYLLEDFTVTHNTLIFGKAFPLWLSIFKPGAQSIIVSKVVKGQSASIVEDIKYMIEDNEFLKEHLAPGDSGLIRTWTKERIVCTNNSKIFNSPYSPSIRGAHVDYIFGDEVSVYPDKSDHYLIWFRDVVTRVADAKHGRIAAVATPVEPGDLSVILVNNKTYASKSYPAIVNYKNQDYTTGESIWPERFPIKRLMELKEEQGSANFERNYMCNSEADVAGSIFKLDNLFGLLDRNKSFTSKLDDQDSYTFIGADFAMSDGPQADFDAYVVVEKMTTGKIIIKHIETWKGLNMEEKMNRLLELANTYRPYQFLCDKSNVGQDIVLKLIQAGWAAEAESFGSLARGQMLGTLKSAVENKLLVVPYSDEIPEEQFVINDLYDQLIGFREDKTEKTRTTTVVSRATHDDIAMALALAVKGAVAQELGGGDVLLSSSGENEVPTRSYFKDETPESPKGKELVNKDTIGPLFKKYKNV